jgi:hypothetical protein
MTSDEKFYAVRQCTSGKFIGSRRMSKAAAERECRVWREHVGPAAVVPARKVSAHAVQAYDQKELRVLLLEHEPTCWISVLSHRGRGQAEQVMKTQFELELGTEYGVYPEKGTRIARGEYYQVPARTTGVLGEIKGVRVLTREPSGGRLFKRWTAADMGLHA